MDSRQKDRQRLAAEAVARLYSGDLTHAEEQNIHAWLADGPENRQEFQSMLEIWDDSADLYAKPVGRQGLRRRKLLGLLGLAAASVLAAVVYWPFPERDAGLTPIEYETAVGENRVVDLSDGSSVTLNTNSRISVEFFAESRRISLDRGEAFFEIERDVDRPLTVFAGDRAITVLGTSFNVNRDGGDIVVAVVEGRVAVHGEADSGQILEGLRERTDNAGSASPITAPSDSVILEAGDVVQVVRQQSSAIKPMSGSAERYQSWRHGYIRFSGEPLSAIVAEINRYSERPILVGEPGLGEVEYSAVFRTDDIETNILNFDIVFPSLTIVDEGTQYVIRRAE